MSDFPDNHDKASQEPLWDTRTTAAYLDVSEKKLEGDRLKGIGLPYVKMGRSVRYVPSVVRAYVARHTVSPAPWAA